MVPQKAKSRKAYKKSCSHCGICGSCGTACNRLPPYQIQEQEQAVLSTLGVPKAVTETGLHFKLPLIQKVHKVNTTIQGFPIGYNQQNNDVVAERRRS